MKNLRKKLAAIVALMIDFTNNNPEPTEEQLKEFEQLETDYANVEAQINRIEKVEAKMKYLDGTDEEPLGAGGNAKDKEQNEYVQNFLNYARTGDNIEFNNTLSTLTGEDGGYLVPDEWAKQIIADLSKETHVRKFATVIQTGGTYNMPLGTSSPTFGWIDELGTYPSTDSKFANKVLEAWKVGGIIKVSEELLEDEQFDLETYLREQATEAIALIEGEAFLVGDGVKKPLGVTEFIHADNKLTTAVTDAITLNDVEDLFLAPKAKHRKKGTWIISEKFFKAIFKMKDADGNRVWSSGFTANEEGRIFNKPYEIDDTLAGLAGEPLAFFGDWSHYKIGDRGAIGLRRITGLYEETGEVGFKIYKRTDGKLTNDKAIAELINKA